MMGYLPGYACSQQVLKMTVDITCQALARVRGEPPRGTCNATLNQSRGVFGRHPRHEP